MYSEQNLHDFASVDKKKLELHSIQLIDVLHMSQCGIGVEHNEQKA